MMLLVVVVVLIAGCSLIDDEFFLFSQSKTGIETSHSVNKSVSLSRNTSRYIGNRTSRDGIVSGQINTNTTGNSLKPWLFDNNNKTSNATKLKNKPEVVSILLDEMQHEDDSWFGRLAFAKLLQLEAASQEYNIPTEIVVVVNSSDSSWTHCFPSMKIKKIIRSDFHHQSLDELLERKELEQQQLLGAVKSLLLKATADSYKDGLYLIKQFYRNASQYVDDSGISVPFLTLDAPPSWSEWTRVEELKEFMQVKPSCCSNAPLLFSSGATDNDEQQQQAENKSVVYLGKHSPLEPAHLSKILNGPNGTRVVLLSPSGNTVNTSLSHFTTELQKKKAYIVESALVAGSLARYCMLKEQQHRIGYEFVANLDSSLAQWVAMTMLEAVPTSARLIGALSSENKNVRSNVRIEPLPDIVSTDIKEAQTKPPMNNSGTGEIFSTDQSIPVGHQNNPVSIVVGLGGEMGNQISMIAHGHSLKWMLAEDYNVSAAVILRHQPHNKWIRARESMVTCYPNIRYMNFSAGNIPEFDERSHQLSRWLGNHMVHIFGFHLAIQEVQIRESLEALVQVLSNVTGRPTVPSNATLTLPFIQTSTYAMGGYVNDRYYDRLRDMFQFDFDNPKCCGNERPQANETVMHVRGYNGEMSRKFKKKGFEELSPNKTVDELLGATANRDEPFTVLSRYDKTAAPYVEALQSNGWKHARFLETENGEHSFCYLIRAQKEMIGYSMSSYSSWGAMLGNASKARLYSLRSPERIVIFGKEGYFFKYNYSTPELKEKMSFESYNSEEQDLEEQHQAELLKSGQRHRYFR